MGDKPATVLDVCFLELVNRIRRPVDCCQRVLLGIPSLVRIVRLVPCFLKINERDRELPDFMRKPLHCFVVEAGTFCVSVFKCAVHLMSSQIAFAADEQVRGGVGQRVEHRIVCRADRATQVDLRGSPPIQPR